MSNTEKLNLTVELTFNEDGSLDMQSFAHSPLIDNLDVDSQGRVCVPNDNTLSEMQISMLATIARFNFNVTRFIEFCLDVELSQEESVDAEASEATVVVPFPTNSTKH